MGRKLPRRESAILLIATSETRLGDTNIKTGAWYVPPYDAEGTVLDPSQSDAADTPMSKGRTLHQGKASMAMCRAETLAEPYYTFRKKGYAVAFASVAGGPIPIDPYSLSPTIMKNYSIKTFMYDSKSFTSINWYYVLRMRI